MFTHPVYINRMASTHPALEEEAVCIPGRRLEAVEPDYKRWIPNATLRRRMSRLVRMGVATGLQCLGESPSVRVDAILTATGLGCLTDTEKFMNTILDNDEQLLTPTTFIQSTFNTIGAQIALLTNNHCYNNTYVHRGFSFESALLDAALLIQEGEACNVLVGAMDEMTPTLYAILERLGCWQHEQAGEGAAFFLLSGEKTAESLAVVQDIGLFSGTCTEDELRTRISAFLLKNEASDASILYPVAYKTLCGEYPTAISFACWLACLRLSEKKNAGYQLLYNMYQGNHSLILLKHI